VKLLESDFKHPALPAGIDLLRQHFRGEVARELRPLRNPHHETEVSAATKATAKPAAVLIPVVQRESDTTLLLTRRHRNIRFAGHICFPGGHRDDMDGSWQDTALREAEEEINLQSESVEIIGRLGDYYSQTGYKIVPVVGLVTPPLNLIPHPDEVDEIIEIPLQVVFDSKSYRLHQTMPGRAHYSLTYQQARVAGPTVSIMMGLYEEIIRSRRAA
jgi:8-oxo-dGTP pyrophosphatase MutT (NUDIX family)